MYLSRHTGWHNRQNTRFHRDKWRFSALVTKIGVYMLSDLHLFTDIPSEIVLWRKISVVPSHLELESIYNNRYYLY